MKEMITVFTETRHRDKPRPLRSFSTLMLSFQLKLKGPASSPGSSNQLLQSCPCFFIGLQ
ncbi:hypothetical protein EYF80_036255 [Liparis tanakae]|uniref:Uncharacterized protein n=1 Tax=Liparis tanakae TaxID=230148 RepID=A0A4Z2GJX0_9TELE|nr:hypothetical protein EYF80_036255 [Liparis tanakae]